MTAVLSDRLITVGIVDDNEMVRGTLRFFLKLSPNIEVVAQAENGSEAIAMVEIFRPNVVLMNIKLPVMNGLDATRTIISRFPNTKVIVLNMKTKQNYTACAYAAGASYFFDKKWDNEEILDAIKECSSAPLKVVGHPPH
jgi:two-component system, NarL family, response regulator DegU